MDLRSRKEAGRRAGGAHYRFDPGVIMSTAPGPGTASTLATRHVVYVHGICPHQPGYSIPWWNAMHPYVPDIPDANRHEVLWSDLITPAVAAAVQVTHAERLTAAAGGLMRPFADAQHPPLAEHIKDILADRAQRQLAEASQKTSAAEALPAGSARAALTQETTGPRALVSIPGLECVDDFTEYLIDMTIRNQVIARFKSVVEPLLIAGARLEVISHSWGTVVAYEALRLLDASPYPDGAVHTLFTPGSALSIPPVKRSLLPQAADGQRPRLVQTWVNLDAKYDIVGGPLRGNPFNVDFEYLDLAPVGCSAWIPNPYCSHGSYFNPDNVAVNQDIFGKFINS
jgi:hypothetical protein